MGTCHSDKRALQGAFCTILLSTPTRDAGQRGHCSSVRAPRGNPGEGIGCPGSGQLGSARRARVRVQHQLQEAVAQILMADRVRQTRAGTAGGSMASPVVVAQVRSHSQAGARELASCVARQPRGRGRSRKRAQGAMEGEKRKKKELNFFYFCSVGRGSQCGGGTWHIACTCRLPSDPRGTAVRARDAAAALRRRGSDSE